MGQKIWNGEAERNRYPSRHLCTSVKHNTWGPEKADKDSNLDCWIGKREEGIDTCIIISFMIKTSLMAIPPSTM